MKKVRLNKIEVSFNLNGKDTFVLLDGSETLLEVLRAEGLLAVRDSDNAEGFCGSDTVLVDGSLEYAGLILAATCEGAIIETPESLAVGGKLNPVQEAMCKAGIVQSAYNAPAAALALTWLLRTNPKATRDDVKNVLSGIFIRDAGYEHYYMAFEMAKEIAKTGKTTIVPAPTFRDGNLYVGKPTGKVDAEQLIKGEPSYVDDKVPAGSLWLEVLRSPHAHAYIKSIDTSEAEKLPGVELIVTAFNCPDVYYMQAGQGNPEPSPHDRRLFNMKVRHVGDRVAGIVATSKEVAQKAKKLIKVEYEVLPAVFTVEQAMSPKAPIVQNGFVEYRAGAPDNLAEYNKGVDPREGKVIYQFPLHADIRHNIAAGAAGEIGDVNKGFGEADKVIERTYQTSQVNCTPLEPHECFAKWQDERLVLSCSTQVSFHVRRIVSWVTGLSENRIHIVKEKVGGGYGAKQDILIEDLVGYCAYTLKKPVFTRYTREEEFIACSTRHPMRVTVKMGAKKDGTITAIQMDVRANTGPYGNHCLTVPMNSCSKTLPLMKVANMKFKVTTYYTNIPPAGAYQGYGAPKGTFGLMCTIAELANELGVDYKDMIQKNHVYEGYMLDILAGLGEGRAGNVVPVGSCGLDKAIEQGCQMINWGKKEKSADPDWKIGKGFAMIQQGSGLPGLDHANCLAKLTTDGNIIILSGGADLGTGLDTISAKFAGEYFKLPLDKVSVISGDTDSTAFDTGSYASSGTYFSGNASLNAVKNLYAKVLHEAALQLNESEADLAIEFPGTVVSKKTGAKKTLGAISHDALQGDGRGHLIAQGTFVTPNNAIPYGAHFAQVAVNVKTGQVKVQKFYALQDAGTPINPEIALCQMYGAAMKSIGHSLYEEMILDKKGRCINANMTDYRVPMIAEAPDDFKAVLIDVNDQYGPMGAKSISEIATNGAAPAIAIAIHDAVGVWVRSWPFTAEKVLKAMGTI